MMAVNLIEPTANDATIGQWALANLQRIVAIDSASDERSATIPSTPGQAELAQAVGTYFEGLGATVERDDFANVIATFPGRGRCADQRPIALLVHLDTARGTAAVEGLNIVPGWDGSRVAYPENSALYVDTDNYPSAAAFAGKDLVHGPGDAPFGLDDKLGLTHMMTLARLLADNEAAEHPPLLLIGRPDEEVGRMEAIVGLAKTLADREVDFGYTVDGILPYEINIENFNASHGGIRFESCDAPADSALTDQVAVYIGGVNTHGCTAKAEGYRAATRLCAEIVEVLVRTRFAPDHVRPLRFVSDELRDCDAVVHFGLCAGPRGDVEAVGAALRDAVSAVIDPHVPRGASWRIEPVKRPVSDAAAGSTWSMLDYVAMLLDDDVDFPVAAEESDGHEGYSNPYRARSDSGDTLLDVRIRDFASHGLRQREAHLASLLPESATLKIEPQYVNMAGGMVQRSELVDWPERAADLLDLDARLLPIRGGTGVDPFLEQGVPIANLGTGYFAPESEKEFTSIQHMVGHAKWLFALVQVVVAERAKALD